MGEIGRAYLENLEPCEDGCQESGTPCAMKEAALWLFDQRRPNRLPYAVAMERPVGEPKERPFIAVTTRLRDSADGGRSVAAASITTAASSTVYTWPGEHATPAFIAALLHRRNAGGFIVTSGKKAHKLEAFLESFGPTLLEAGYTIQPGMSGNKLAFLTMRKGGRTWRMVYAEVMTGAGLATLHGYAQDALNVYQESETPEWLTTSVSAARGYLKGSSAALYTAIAAFARFLKVRFGSAPGLTAGMTAWQCARRTLPIWFKKWLPPSEVVAWEREGKGYRGGMTYAERFRGESWRIDVNRQYTGALRSKLPYRVGFGRYQDGDDGLFLCHVRAEECAIPYPIGRWDGSGFLSETAITRGSHVCVLHSSEFPGMRALGAIIVPWYGYIYTQTFSFSTYVDSLQVILDENGRESNIAKLSKPLGNFLYGKMGQNPEQKEILYSLEHPGEEWWPYRDADLIAWPMMWERDARRVTSSQHVDVAAAVTGHARSQTALTWRWLSECGVEVVRVHTDSLTTASDPMPFVTTSESAIGSYRLEQDRQTIIVNAANCFADDSGAHIAGVSEPTWEMVERIHDGFNVAIDQDMMTPLRGFSRERRIVHREYGTG